MSHSHFLLTWQLWFVGKAIEQIHGFFPAVVQFVVPAIGESLSFSLTLHCLYDDCQSHKPHLILLMFPGGTILSAIFLPEYITVGASGGIFGLIGGCIADIIVSKKDMHTYYVEHIFWNQEYNSLTYSLTSYR